MRGYRSAEREGCVEAELKSRDTRPGRTIQHDRHDTKPTRMLNLDLIEVRVEWSVT
jgi:hypothetical protein